MKQIGCLGHPLPLPSKCSMRTIWRLSSMKNSPTTGKNNRPAVSHFMYESKTHAPLTRARFVQRLLLHAAAALGLLLVSLGAGMLGYAWFEHLPWIDGFLNSAMLLGGM